MASAHRLLAALAPMTAALLLVASGCKQDPADDDDTTTDEPNCEGGFVYDPDLPEEFLEEYPDGCVPEECGVGRWGDLEVDGDTVYVDVAAPDGGDGSEEAPYNVIQDGLDAAGEAGGGLVAVAAGTYHEVLDVDGDPEDIVLVGRCRELVVLDASAGDAGAAGIHVDLDRGALSSFHVAGLTIANALYRGITVTQGNVELSELLLVENHKAGMGLFGPNTRVQIENTVICDSLADDTGAGGVGVDVEDGASVSGIAMDLSGNLVAGFFIEDPGTSVVLNDIQIRDTQPNEEGLYGRGIRIRRGASLLARRCLLERNTEIGIYVSDTGTSVELVEVEVVQTQFSVDGTWGRGIQINEGASLHAESCLFAENVQVGLSATDSGTEVVLQDMEVRDTQPLPDGTDGRGIEVSGGARLQAVSCLVEGNAEFGIFASNEGTEVVLQGVEVRDTKPSHYGTGGQGINVQEGARLEASECAVEGNTGVGIIAGYEGTEVVLQGVDVRDTQPLPDGTFGRGIEVQNGARLEASECAVEGNTDVGICASNEGTEVVLQGVEVRDTKPSPYGTGGRGINVQRGARLEASSCVVEGNADLGILASEGVTEVSLVETVISGTLRPWGAERTVSIGLQSQLDASVHASGISITGTEGPGVFAAREGMLSCEGCALYNNAFAGAVVWAGGVLELTNTSVLGNGPDDELGGGVGIYASDRGGSSSLVLADSEVSAHDYAAVWLDSRWPFDDGSYALSGNTLHGGDGQDLSPTVHAHGDAVFATGVSAWDGEQGLLLENNTLMDSAGAGVFLDGSSALLSGNTYIDNAVDLWQQDCDGIPLPVGLEEAQIAELCPEYDRITAPIEFHLVLEEELTKKSMDRAMELPMPFPLLEPLPSVPMRPMEAIPLLEPLPPLPAPRSR